MRKRKRIIDEVTNLDISGLIAESASILSYRAVADEAIPYTDVKADDVVLVSNRGRKGWRLTITRDTLPASARLSLHKKRGDIVAQTSWFGERLYVYLEPNVLIQYAKFKLSLDNINIRDAMQRMERALLIALDFVPLNERAIDKFGKLKNLALGNGSTSHEQHTTALMALKLIQKMITK